MSEFSLIEGQNSEDTRQLFIEDIIEPAGVLLGNTEIVRIGIPTGHKYPLTSQGTRWKLPVESSKLTDSAPSG
jgi:hypothetical protein